MGVVVEVGRRPEDGVDPANVPAPGGTDRRQDVARHLANAPVHHHAADLAHHLVGMTAAEILLDDATLLEGMIETNDGIVGIVTNEMINAAVHEIGRTIEGTEAALETVSEVRIEKRTIGEATPGIANLRGTAKIREAVQILEIETRKMTDVTTEETTSGMIGTSATISVTIVKMKSVVGIGIVTNMAGTTRTLETKLTNTTENVLEPRRRDGNGILLFKTASIVTTTQSQTQLSGDRRPAV